MRFLCIRLFVWAIKGTVAYIEETNLGIERLGAFVESNDSGPVTLSALMIAEGEGEKSRGEHFEDL